MSKYQLLKTVLTLLIIVFILNGCSLNENLEPTEENTTTAPPTTENTPLPTTTAPTTSDIKEEMTKLWARGDINIREKPSTDSKKIGVLHEGNGIICTGKASNGWSKVLFNGSEAYIRSDLLTDKEPTRAVSSDRVLVNPYSDLWYLAVVDSDREIPADYVPELAEIASSDQYMDARVAPYYNDMYAAAKKDGITLTPYSGYRSYARQQRNYNNLTEAYMSEYNLSREDAAKKAATVILPPGTSEHNLGLAIDICNTNSSFSTQKEYKWLMEHAHKYGFILRYTVEKQDITGIIPEPWHWRFVGVEHAGKIKDSGLCLEEYLQKEGIAY